MWRDFYKGSSAENAESKLLKDVLSVRIFGTVQEIAKLEIGLSIKSSVMLRLSR